MVRERISTPDGDFVDLDLMPDPAPRAPVVLVLHGLEGSSERGYMRLALDHLFRRGLRGVALNFRSCSGEPNRTARFYHSGDTEDVGLALAHLRERFPARRFGALGFSLGGNVLLKYLGEGSDALQDEVGAAAAISVPFDLDQGARAIERGPMGHVYSYYFLQSLREKVHRKEALLRGLVDLEEVLSARTLREYDDAATAPLHGFSSAEEYYSRCSSSRFLPEVRVPTLLLQSEDDPFLPADALPRAAVAANPHLLPAFTAAGGHVGFVEGSVPWKADFWAEREAARYLATLLDPDTGGT